MIARCERLATPVRSVPDFVPRSARVIFYGVSHGAEWSEEILRAVKFALSFHVDDVWSEHCTLEWKKNVGRGVSKENVLNKLAELSIKSLAFNWKYCMLW